MNLIGEYAGFSHLAWIRCPNLDPNSEHRHQVLAPLPVDPAPAIIIKAWAKTVLAPGSDPSWVNMAGWKILQIILRLIAYS